MAIKGFYNHTRIDYNGEKSTHRVRVAEITAVNFAGEATKRAAYAVAIAGICNGSFNKSQHLNEDFLTESPSDSPLDQREIKWLVSYLDDTTGQRYSVELPCADLAVLDANDRAHAAIGDAGPVDAFVTAFEDFVLSPDGNTVTVEEITFVGRNI